MYRPDNWKNPYEYKGIISQQPVENLMTGKVRSRREIDFEDGADAMLEALIKHRLNFKDDEFNIFITKKMDTKGSLVFIPEE